MNKVSKSDISKLNNSGWQSWSYATKKTAKFPLMIFNPKNKSRFVPKQINSTIKKPAYGWCSWYIYGQDINDKLILNQAKWISKNKVSKKLPLEYILIDGGWCLSGDWTEENKVKFPNGLKSVAKEIKRLGLKPGIWISPFLVDKKSNISKYHPDWLVNKNGSLVDGFKLTPYDKYFAYGKWILDIRKPEVVKYLDKSIKYLVEDCGFELLKLDFLYSIYFDPNISSTEADLFLNNFLLKIKNKYPSVYTIACGCPLLPAIGTIDSMRIGPDTSVGPFIKFLPLPFFSQKYLDYQVISTVSNRLWTKKFWNVDPDAYMCRKTLNFLPKQLLKFQNVIQQCEGNIFLGDDLSKLSDERIDKYICPLFKK